MDYMHALGILHRDMASKNILFNTNGDVKVCDFGISRCAFANVASISSSKKGSLASSSSSSAAKQSQQQAPEIFHTAANLEPPKLCVTLLFRSIELLLGDQNYGP